MTPIDVRMCGGDRRRGMPVGGVSDVISHGSETTGDRVKPVSNGPAMLGDGSGRSGSLSGRAPCAAAVSRNSHRATARAIYAKNAPGGADVESARKFAGPGSAYIMRGAPRVAGHTGARGSTRSAIHDAPEVLAVLARRHVPASGRQTRGIG